MENSAMAERRGQRASFSPFSAFSAKAIRTRDVAEEISFPYSFTWLS